MLKKLFAFMCGLAPFGAMAAGEPVPVQDVTSLDGYVSSDTTNIVMGGNVVIGDDINAAVQTDGIRALIVKDVTSGPALNVSDAMNVFADVPVALPGGGTFYVGDNVASDGFSLLVGGDVNVGGVLTVDGDTTRTFNIMGYGTGNDFSVTTGSVNNTANFNVVNALNFNSGLVQNSGDISISATNNIVLGAVENISGTATFTAGNDLTIDSDFVNNAGTGVVLNAKTVSVQSVQNLGVGTMTITANEALSATSIENKGNTLDIEASGASVLVTGTMSNDSGSMTIKASSLNINGGDANNPSFVSNGNLNITVSGQTNLAYGFDLGMSDSAMWNNKFYLETASLNLGAGNTGAFFANNLNDYDVIINSGFVTGDVSNGLQNNAANMYLAANGLTVEDVVNNAGTMRLAALSNSDLRADSVTDRAGTVTDLTSGGNIVIAGDVTTNAEMNLSAQTIDVGGIVGNGGTLTVAGGTGQNGMVTVNNNVTNSNGTVDISGRQINIVGNVDNKSGTISVGGSDLQGSAIQLGGVIVEEGVANLNGLLGINISQSVIGGNTFGTGTMVVSDGVLNFGTGTHSVTINGPAGNSGYVVDIAGNVIASGNSGTSGTGDVYVQASGNQGFLLNANGDISIGGNVLANTSTTVARTLMLASGNNYVKGDVNATGALNKILFQGYMAPDFDLSEATMRPVANLTIDGNLIASNGGVVEMHSKNIELGSVSDDGGVFYVYGDGNDSVQMNILAGGITLQDAITFNSSVVANTGLVVNQTPEFSIVSNDTGADIVLGGVNLGTGAKLVLDSGRNISISGDDDLYLRGVLDVDANKNVVFQEDVIVSGTLDIDAYYIDLAAVENSGSLILKSGDDINMGALKNLASASGGTITAVGDLYADSVTSNGGNMDVVADSLSVNDALSVTGGMLNLDVANGITFGGDASVSGVMNQGVNKTGMLNLVTDDISFVANSLTVSGFTADSGVGTYDIGGDIAVNGNMTIADLATVNMSADAFSNELAGIGASLLTNFGKLNLTVTTDAIFEDVVNSGTFNVTASDSIKMTMVNNAGDMSLDVGTGLINMAGLAVTDGGVNVKSSGLNVSGQITTPGVLYQNYTGVLSNGDINVNSNDFSLTAGNVNVGGINQVYDTVMNIYSSDVTVNGDIDVYDLTIAAQPSNNWLDLDVHGNILGGTKILNLEQMTVDGDYIFDKDSQLLAAILSYNSTPGMNSTTRNYWSTVSLNPDSTFGQITNAIDGKALVEIKGENSQFIAGAKYNANLTLGSTLDDGQIGLVLQDLDKISSDTAIWLVHAEGGVLDASQSEKNRYLPVVLFCNVDGTSCVSMGESLGAYISMRDSDNSGSADSLYVVFDPRFGGPVFIESNKIQPIVARQPDHTPGEYVAAGALDNLIAAQLKNSGFVAKSPIEVIPEIFKDTNLNVLMTELYKRYERYAETANGAIFMPFSRLVQPREIEQIAGAIVMNEHTSARNFEDRMLDEFIWNRNRNLEKGWLDFDFGMFTQDVTDGKRAEGNRFELSGGVDWQESDTLILGLTARVSRSSSSDDDYMDLAYLPSSNVPGAVSVDVADTNVGFGAYLIKTLGQKFRVYGNGFLDLHLLDTKREMTFMETIDGAGSAVALTTEWGLMHDWLNQYIVGNLYARAGYNFGFCLTEKVADEDYMDMESDGYFMLTPGYSLTAQKRIYPTAWFQIRPYATIGVEYDLLGAPDYVKYKFAVSKTFSEYDIDINPLWANIGGGFEMLSANGIQLGIDYRYQYNNDMQLHNIKLSGSYRF